MMWHWSEITFKKFMIQKAGGLHHFIKGGDLKYGYFTEFGDEEGNALLRIEERPLSNIPVLEQTVCYEWRLM